MGDYLAGRRWALKSSTLFHGLGNAAGEDRAAVELAYALQRLARMDGCYSVAHSLVNRDPRFAWIRADGLLEDGICDTGPGTATDDVPSFVRAARITEDHHFALLEMRARNQMGGIAIESDDIEDVWRIYLKTIRRFYAGDFPPFRAFTIMSGLAEVEKSTPRVHLELLLQREVMGLLELTDSRDLVPAQRFDLAIAAIRAGYVPEAQEELRKVRSELAANGGDKPTQSYLADSEIAMAELYMARGDLREAAATLASAHQHMAGVDDYVIQRDYAAARGQLELTLGHPDQAEATLRNAILDEERQAHGVGAANIIIAQQDRDLYAVLAGVWLAQGRPGEDILALWERYRLSILGEPVPVCPDKGLTCLKPQLKSALARLGNDRLMGQVVLLDRTLLFEATAQGVVWNSTPVGREYALAAAARLERAVSSPATSQQSVDAAARLVGSLFLFLHDLPEPAPGNDQLSLEPDPLLGNLPWAAAETAGGPIGLRFSIEEAPSLLLAQRRGDSRWSRTLAAGNGPLVVGASFAAGKSVLLPEVLNEARAVAHFARNTNLLLGDQATEAQVVARLGTAPVIHFAGHATEEDGTTRLLLAPAGAGSTGTGADTPYLDSELLRKHPPRAARLAVFSACSTGKREEGWNHGMEDIVNTLASLGVPQVVATRWQIDSSSAVPMMDAFYGGLARGLSVPRALTAARQSLSRDTRYRHPYFWAAYYASGWGNSDMSEVFHGSNN